MSSKYVTVKIEDELYKAAENHYHKWERGYRAVGVKSAEQLIGIWLLELLIRFQETKEAEKNA